MPLLHLTSPHFASLRLTSPHFCCNLRHSCDQATLPSSAHFSRLLSKLLQLLLRSRIPTSSGRFKTSKLTSGLEKCESIQIQRLPPCVPSQLRRRDKERNPARPFLLLVPASLIPQWAEELHRYTNVLDIIIYHGNYRQKSIALRGKATVSRIQRTLTRNDAIFRSDNISTTVIISSYETWATRHGRQGRKDWSHRHFNDRNHEPQNFGTPHTEWPMDLNGMFEAVLCDEAQHLKNSESAQNESVARLKAQWHILATATPVWTNIMDCLGYLNLIQHPRFATAFAKGSASLGIARKQNVYDLEPSHPAHPATATFNAYNEYVLSLPDSEATLKGSRLKQAWRHILMMMSGG